MKYFFVLGNNPTLSIAEILSVFPDNNSGEFLNNDIFLLSSKEIAPKEVIKRLGGTIKIGKIIKEINKNEKDFNKKEITTIIKKKAEKRKEKKGKFKFGVSYYGKIKINKKALGMEIKKVLKKEDVNSRWVISKEETLSSVVVEQNKLIDKGVEIVLIKNNGKILIGTTKTVQPFKELSYRDYGRPARDDLSGMLPPKLAKIMLNFSGKINKNTILLDPFCGSGTILMEALLMGIKKMTGSDISTKAIEDSLKNLKWLEKNFKLQSTNYKLLNTSSTQLSRKIGLKSVDIIVTEPYLGPQRGWHDIKKTIRKLEILYSKSFDEFKKILKDDGTIVMIWPIFNIKTSQKETILKSINPDTNDFKIINPIPEYIRKNINIKLTSRNTIIYGRPGQKIFREIIILKK